jgi:hypothetical protein
MPKDGFTNQMWGLLGLGTGDALALRTALHRTVRKYARLGESDYYALHNFEQDFIHHLREEQQKGT